MRKCNLTNPMVKRMSPGLVVIGGGWRLRDCEFEYSHWILYGSFIYWKIALLFEKTEKIEKDKWRQRLCHSYFQRQRYSVLNQPSAIIIKNLYLQSTVWNRWKLKKRPGIEEEWNPYLLILSSKVSAEQTPSWCFTWCTPTFTDQIFSHPIFASFTEGRENMTNYSRVSLTQIFLRWLHLKYLAWFYKRGSGQWNSRLICHIFAKQIATNGCKSILSVKVGWHVLL